MHKNHIVAFLTFLTSALSLPIAAEVVTVTSPDGRTVVTLTDNNAQAEWSVTFDGVPVITPSPLGIDSDIHAPFDNLTLSAAERDTVIDDYSLDRAKVSHVHYEANRLIATYSDPHHKLFKVEFRVSNNNIAFRYLLPMLHDHRCTVVQEEATTFSFPEGSTCFLTPQSDPMTGWKGTKPSYEEEYMIDAPVGTPSQYGHGFTFPCLFKSNGVWVLVSETDVDSHYCGSRLGEPTPDGHYTIAYPMEGENNGFGSTGAQIALPGHTPWRTVTVGDLKAITETTIAFDVVEPRYTPSINYHYGRGTWSWEVWDDASINETDIRAYIDLAAALKWEYCLIDNYWDRNIGREKIEQLSRYAQSLGVSLFLWYNSSGAWNDTTQSPYDVMSNIITRRKEMAWMKDIGVKGIKVDFWGGDKQETMRLYEEVLADANDYGLMVIFHGCTLPRGWERMYPNYVGSEAVLASENLKFSQHMDDMEAVNACLHPFIRNTVGCMEFGGSALNKYYSRDNAHGNHRVCGDAFELACAVLFQNPIQNFALTPNNLTDAPAEAIDFMRGVPTTWDETRYIDGIPGQYVVLARRHANCWYIAAINATDKPLSVSVEPSLFGYNGKTVKTYMDDKTMAFCTKDIKITRKGMLPLSIPTNGGAVLVLPLNE